MNYPLVTIAIPTYNRADRFLKEAIQSALNQTYSNLEIIVADNYSTDDTESIVKSYSEGRLRYFRHPKNIGGNNNFNYCLKKAKGAYFLLLHDDDLIDKDFIEICVKAAKGRRDVGTIRTGMRRIDSDGNVIREKENLVGGWSAEDFFLGWFNGKTPMHLCCTLFNTEKLLENGGFKSKNNLFDDVLINVILAAKYNRVDVREIKASFREHHEQNAYSVPIQAWCEDSLELFEKICELSATNQELIRKTGKTFFSNHCYKHASAIRSPIKRFSAYTLIFRTFDYKIGYFEKRFKKKIKKYLNM